MFMRVISTGSTKGNCYALQSSADEIVLLDCGCNYKKILRGIDYQISNVSGVLLSHEHGDHTGNHNKTVREIMNAGITVYTGAETIKNLGITDGTIKAVTKKRYFKIGSFSAVPFNLPHTSANKEPCPNFGYLVEHEEMGKLLYLTDFEHCRYKFKSMEPDHLVIGCNYCEELIDRNNPKWEHQITGHCSLSTCKQFIKENRTESLRTVTLVHLSGDSSDACKIQKEIQEVAGDNVLVQIGRAGLEVDLNLCPF